MSPPRSPAPATPKHPGSCRKAGGKVLRQGLHGGHSSAGCESAGLEGAQRSGRCLGAVSSNSRAPRCPRGAVKGECCWLVLGGAPRPRVSKGAAVLPAAGPGLGFEHHALGIVPTSPSCLPNKGGRRRSTGLLFVGWPLYQPLGTRRKHESRSDWSPQVGAGTVLFSS